MKRFIVLLLLLGEAVRSANQDIEFVYEWKPKVTHDEVAEWLVLFAGFPDTHTMWDRLLQGIYSDTTKCKQKKDKLLKLIILSFPAIFKNNRRFFRNHR